MHACSLWWRRVEGQNCSSERAIKKGWEDIQEQAVERRARQNTIGSCIRDSMSV